MEVASYQQLKVWQLGMRIARDVYLLSQSFPSHELYGLTSQIRRAAVSAPSNIAEGRARSSSREFLHHISIAQGSLAELETLLKLAENLNYCAQADAAAILDQCDEEGKMLRGLQKSLRVKLSSSP
jgi:four helix bundle protein